MGEQEKVNPITLDEIETLADRIIKKINSLPVSERENRMNYVLEVIARGIHTQEVEKISIKSGESANLTVFGILIFLVGLLFWIIFPGIGYLLAGLGGFMFLIGLISSMFKK